MHYIPTMTSLHRIWMHSTIIWVRYIRVSNCSFTTDVLLCVSSSLIYVNLLIYCSIDMNLYGKNVCQNDSHLCCSFLYVLHHEMVVIYNKRNNFKGEKRRRILWNFASFVNCDNKSLLLFFSASYYKCDRVKFLL